MVRVENYETMSEFVKVIPGILYSFFQTLCMRFIVGLYLVVA